MQIDFGRSGSWLDDHTAAENITSSNAASNRSRIASDALARDSQVSATDARAARTVGCSSSSSAASSWACCSAVATGCMRRSLATKCQY